MLKVSDVGKPPLFESGGFWRRPDADNGHRIKNGLMPMIAISELFKGLMILNLVLSPLTVFITLFIAIMGGSHPSKPGVLSAVGIAAGFVYGAPLGVLIGLVVFGKVADFFLRIAPLTTPAVSGLGLLIAALLLVIAGNIFIDHLYQFRKGDYTLSLLALFLILLYVVLVYFSARIPILGLSL